ncbi:hypothetical protein C0992_001460 [Termitomyces sp. T32_za158]|nr:hypothetical protein C0992_001460 [Termitomyces sp. T32_za158]
MKTSSECQLRLALFLLPPSVPTTLPWARPNLPASSPFITINTPYLELADFLSFFNAHLEKEQKRSQDNEDEGSMLPDDGMEYTHPEQAGLAVPGTTSGFFNESADNLLLTRMGPDGTRYQDLNAEYGGGGLSTPGYDAHGFGGHGRGADGSGKGQ